MDFRVALVVIATLVVTERPLSAGAKDLVWVAWRETENPDDLFLKACERLWGEMNIIN